MTAKILQFKSWREKMKRKFNREFRLLFKHRRLIADAARRGYSPLAIEKLVRAAEASKGEAK